MEDNAPVDSEALKLALPNTVDPSDNESGIGSCQSDEDLHLLTACAVSESMTPTLKPKRRVQFQTAENLVLIREIPPRGFYGSDVSDTDSGADEGEDDDDGTDDEEDDKDDDGQQSSSDDQEESDSSSDSEEEDDDASGKSRVLLIKTPVTTGSYSVGKVSGRSAEKISKITSMTLLPQSSSVVDNKTVAKNEKNTKTIPRRYRQRKSGVSPNIKNPNRPLVADGKKRRNSTKTSNLMKSTSSSRNKENHKKLVNHLQSASSPSSNKKQILNKQKSVVKISIDSPLQTSNRISSALYCSQSLNRRPSSSIKVYSSVRPNSASASLSYASCLGASRNKQFSQLPNIGTAAVGALKTYPTHKQYNAWQVANGNLDGKNLHTPSIAPMWENVHTLPSGKPKSKNLINQ